MSDQDKTGNTVGDPEPVSALLTTEAQYRATDLVVERRRDAL